MENKEESGEVKEGETEKEKENEKEKEKEEVDVRSRFDSYESVMKQSRQYSIDILNIIFRNSNITLIFNIYSPTTFVLQRRDGEHTH